MLTGLAVKACVMVGCFVSLPIVGTAVILDNLGYRISEGVKHIVPHKKGVKKHADNE